MDSIPEEIKMFVKGAMSQCPSPNVTSTSCMQLPSVKFSMKYNSLNCQTHVALADLELAGMGLASCAARESTSNEVNFL